MNAVSAAELQRRIVLLVGQARNGTRELGGRIDQIWSNTERLTIEARRADVVAAIREGGPEVRAHLVVARGALRMGNAEVDGILKDLRHVPDEVLDTRARILSPILSGALARPEAIEGAYRRRFGNLADRQILEDSAEVLIGALAGTEEGQGFAQRWPLLTQELSASLPEAEREALSHRATLDELGRYLDAAERVVEFELAALDPETETPPRAMIGIERHRAFLTRYEDENASALGGLTSSS